jgi:hypothetical protein
MNLIEFLRTYPDTDTNFDKNDKLIIEAYNEEGDIIDIYHDCMPDIAGYFERKFGRDYEYHGNGLINYEFNGSYDAALNAIKEDLDL